MSQASLPRAVLRLRAAVAADGATPDTELLRRFRERRDPAAFEALVRRHGPGVLSACRRVLSDPADVEDAFQAAFLIFLRDARTVRRGQAVGAWLYGVAHRVALKARAARRRRSLVESRAPDRAPGQSPDLSWREAVAVLHEELDRLPDKYRFPLLLCYLEGLSRDEAAARLGVSLNAIRNRLERGRDRLRARLKRRGIALSAGLLATLSGPATAAVPPAFVQSVLSGVRPAERVADLAAAPGNWGTIQAISAAAIAAGVVIGVGLGHERLRADPATNEVPTKAAATKDAPKTTPAVSRSLHAKGRVLDSDGKPVRGAKLWLAVHFSASPKPEPAPKVVATTDAEGRFEFTDDGKDRPDHWILSARVVATADSFGPAWVGADAAQQKPIDLKLVKDEPIAGRILTLEGKPVAGARVRVMEVARPKDGDLSKWLADLNARERSFHEITPGHFHYEHRLTHGGHVIPGQPEAAITDADGRFTIRGTGAERLVELRIEGPTIATVEKTVMTRAVANLTVAEDPGDSRYGTRTYYGAKFDFAAEPTQPFEGVVTDRETGKPVAGATVRAARLWYQLTTTTDKDGRYRLTGLPPGQHELIACPTPEQPYHRMAASGGLRASQQPVKLDFALSRGVWVAGKVVNARTGKPEAGAPVRYVPLAEEPALQMVPGSQAWSLDPTTYTAADGSFRVVAFPCRGVIAVTGYGGDYISADQQPAQGDVSSLDRGMIGPDTINTSPVLHLGSYHAAAVVNVDAKQPKDYTITLDPGATVQVRLVDPAGTPVDGAHIGAQSTWGLWTPPAKSADVEITQFNPDKPRAVLFQQPGRALGKVLSPRKGDLGPWTVTLEPTGTATGRLVTEDGTPVPNAVFRIHYCMPDRDIWTPSMIHEDVRTDAEGKFRVPNLVAGMTYSLDHAADKGGGRQMRHYVRVKLKAGETKDLGDVKPGD